ncbi:MAG: Lipoprotein-releasing system ATP-binding protein LolD [Planctomycetota bacterium]|jgi:lipoprotein-releasing system ATP-binding protein
MNNSESTRQPLIPAPHMLEMDSKTATPYRVIRPEETEGAKSKRHSHLGVADPMITATGLFKSYRRHKTSVPVLKGVDFVAAKGRVTAIIGQSGSGKSTLLHLLGTLDRPDAGEIAFDGQRIDCLGSRDRDAFRNQQLGMIFQFYHLLPELTLLENVLAPAMIQHGVLSYWRNRRSIHQRAKNLIDLVGLSHRMKHRPRELSGGEMQRTAIARALISNPSLLLADEPTGNLDQESGQTILSILRRLNREHGLTIVMVTHDESIAQQCDSVVKLKDGKVERLQPTVLRTTSV